MIQVRHFPNQSTILRTIEQNLIFALPLIGIGLFAGITGLLKWSKLIQWPADRKSLALDT